MPWLHALLDVPDDLHDRTADFWSRALGWPLGDPWPGHPELRSLEPPEGTAYVHLQRVEDSPRLHLDVESDDLDATTRHALDLGATLVAELEEWRTLRSPGGLLHCVVPAAAHELPPPTTWPAGHRSRLVQVCVDSPRSAHEAEVAYWSALLGDDLRPSRSPEFAGKWHADGSPVQLLFQRLDETSGEVRAHLDLGTDDRDAEVSRLLGLGAEDVAPGRGWHVLRDPVGTVFCVTDNSPASTRERDLG